MNRIIAITITVLFVFGAVLSAHAGKKAKKKTENREEPRLDEPAPHPPKEFSSKLSLSDFDKLVLGKSSKKEVIAKLGSPNWRFIYLAEKDDVPVQPRHTIDPVFAEKKISEMEKLWVYEYWTDDPARSYYVVLRNDKVFYWIGPVAGDEKTVADVEKRYGTVTITYERSQQGDRVDAIELARFDEVIFLRPPGGDEFNAKLVRPKL